MKSRLTLLSSLFFLLHFLLHEKEMRERSSYTGRNMLSSFEVAVFFPQALWRILSISFKKAIPYAKAALRFGLLRPFL